MKNIPHVQTQQPIPPDYTFDGYDAPSSSSNPGTMFLEEAIELWLAGRDFRSLTAFSNPNDESGWPIMSVWNEVTERWSPWEAC
jgi:hypothetical protein